MDEEEDCLDLQPLRQPAAAGAKGEYAAFARKFADLCRQCELPTPECCYLEYKEAELKSSKSTNHPDVPRLCQVCVDGERDADLTHGVIGVVGAMLLRDHLQTKARDTTRHLRLDYNKLGDSGLAHIAEGLSGTPEAQLQHLSLDCNELSSAGILKLKSDFLMSTTQLTSLYVNNNHIGTEGVRLICEAAASPGSKIAYLHMQQVGMCSGAGRHIRLLVERTNSLHTLLLNRNRDFGDEGVIEMTDGLEANATLKHLGVGDVGMTARGAKQLARVYHRHNLLDMIVGPNNLGDLGASYFADALEKTTSVREVVMSRCGITDSGMRYISNALLRNEGHGVVRVNAESNIGSLTPTTYQNWRRVLRKDLEIVLSSERRRKSLTGRTADTPWIFAKPLQVKEVREGKEPLAPPPTGQRSGWGADEPVDAGNSASSRPPDTSGRPPLHSPVVAPAAAPPAPAAIQAAPPQQVPVTDRASIASEESGEVVRGARDVQEPSSPPPPPPPPVATADVQPTEIRHRTEKPVGDGCCSSCVIS